MPSDTCSTCRFFRASPFGGQHQGSCRRRPPTREGWPDVGLAQWCGEFEAAAPVMEIPDEGRRGPGGEALS